MRRLCVAQGSSKPPASPQADTEGKKEMEKFRTQQAKHRDSVLAHIQSNEEARMAARAALRCQNCRLE